MVNSLRFPYRDPVWLQDFENTMRNFFKWIFLINLNPYNYQFIFPHFFNT